MRGVRTAKGSLLLKKPRTGRLARPRLPGRQLDLALGGARLRRHRADPLLGGRHRRRQRGQGRRPRPHRRRSHLQLGLDGRVGRSTTRAVRRQSLASQTDDLGRVNVDTWVAAAPVDPVAGARDPLPQRRHQARSCASTGSAPWPAPSPPAATRRPRRPARRPAPSSTSRAYSQMTHGGHYPQWGGGGEAWCSPTSTAMVLGHYGLQPGPFPAVTAGHADPQVDHTARLVYDHRYGGTGNWAFNTAYAVDAHLRRRLRHPAARPARGRGPTSSPASRWSSRSPSGRASSTGAPISSSNGHLLVIVGFEADGDVVVNDPAGATQRRRAPRLRPRRARGRLDQRRAAARRTSSTADAHSRRGR